MIVSYSTVLRFEQEQPIRYIWWGIVWSHADVCAAGSSTTECWLFLPQMFVSVVYTLRRLSVLDVAVGTHLRRN